MALKSLFYFLKQFETRLLQVVSSQLGQGPPLAFDVNVPVGETHAVQNNSSTDAKSMLDDLFGDGFLWVAVPRTRVPYERRNLRRHGRHKMEEIKLRNNIVACLRCGHFHLQHTICGNCYEKVKEETAAMQAKMDEIDDGVARNYNHPQTEVVYLYKDEEDKREMYNGKYIVEMNRDRPTWWPKNMLTKATGRR